MFENPEEARTDMFENLIVYQGLEEACETMFGFSVVTFKRDFGPWKAGDTVDTMWFHLDKGIVEERTDEDTLVKSCKFQLQAIV